MSCARDLERLALGIQIREVGVLQVQINQMKLVKELFRPRPCDKGVSLTRSPKKASSNHLIQEHEGVERAHEFIVSHDPIKRAILLEQ